MLDYSTSLCKEEDEGSCVVCSAIVLYSTLLKIGCDGHTNYRSHQRCDRSHRLFRVTLTPILPFALLRNRVQPLF